MRNRLFLAVALVLVISLPSHANAASEITQEQVDAALDARRAASASLEDMTARFEQAAADEELTRERIVSLSKSVSQLEQDMGAKRTEVKGLVVERYMSGGPLGTQRVWTTSAFTDIPVQDQYYGLANARDIEILRGLESAEALLVEQQALLDQSLESQRALVSEIQGLTEQILTQLEDADAEYNSIAIAYEQQEEEKRRQAEEERIRREEAARKAAEEAARLATSTTSSTAATVSTTSTTPSTTTTSDGGDSTTTTTEPETTTTTTTPPAPAPVVTDGKTCPINAATSFSDTWGAPRSGGRVHMGVDLMAARNAPIVAIESGTITRTSVSTLGGISIYLTGVSGSQYYYAHLEALADGVHGGMAVSVGDLIGYNGSSGNAPDWLPHLHFQYAPPGSDWVNPYPLVKALCG